MSDENPSAISHVSIGTNDFARATEFYDRVLGVLGCKRILDFPGAVAYGKQFPEFWVQTPSDGQPASVANGVHIGFLAHSQDAVKAFYEAAIAAGGRDAGASGPRRDYGCFVRDPDGHKIEAAMH